MAGLQTSLLGAWHPASLDDGRGQVVEFLVRDAVLTGRLQSGLLICERISHFIAFSCEVLCGSLAARLYFARSTTRREAASAITGLTLIPRAART